MVRISDFIIQNTYAQELATGKSCTDNSDCDSWQTCEVQGSIPATTSKVCTYTNEGSANELQKKAKCWISYGNFFKEVQWDSCMCHPTIPNSTNNEEQLVLCTSLSQDILTQQFCTNNTTKLKYSVRSTTKWDCDCPNWVTDDGRNECIVNNEGLLGIDCNGEKLMNNTCSRNINKTLGIRASDPNPNPTWLLQDVTLAATSFIGTLLMVALLYLWVKAVLAGWGDSDELSDIKTKMKNLAIWFLLVIASYTIIRLIQYIAKGV